MNINKKFNFTVPIFFLSLFLINTIHAEVPFTWMLGICAIINSTHHHLLPIKGMIWSEQNIVNHMYRNGNSKDATIKLVHELFYLQEDMVSFRPTILKNKPASYWKPKDVGMLIAAITAYREDNIQEDIKDATLRTALENIIQPQRTLIKDATNKIATLITTKKEILQDITQQNKGLYSRIGQAQRKPSNTIIQLNQKITEVDQLETQYYFLTDTKEPIEQDIKKLKYDQKFLNRALQKEITALIDHIINSVKESALNDKNKKYTTYTTESILLTFLWKIANPRNCDIPKQDFVDYFNQLNDTIIDRHNVQTWIATQPYTTRNYIEFNENINAIHPDMRKHYMAQHYEQTILAIKGQMLWTSFLPPIITEAGAIYTRPDGTQTERSPGCVETSFRNFLNIILYNAVKKMFDIKRLIDSPQKNTNDIPLQLDQNLINFYNKNRCITNLQASDLYNDWTNVTKNLSGVLYMKPSEYAPHARFYEIKSSFKNMLVLCNHLLFANNPIVNQLPKEKQLDLLCHTVSRDDFLLSWKIADSEVKHDMLENREYIILKFIINKTHSFEWQLNKGHSVIPRLDILT